jgi:hypothetical protein
MTRALLCALLALSLVYVGDFVSVRYRIPKTREPYGTVKVRRYYAVGLKSGKTDYMFLDPQNQVCVHSLFPHLGYPPCWYLTRHPVKKIEM